MKNKILKLINLNSIIQETINNKNLYPSQKHAIIFSNNISGEVKKILKSLNLNLDNIQSNNYEEDMLQYSISVKNITSQLEQLVINNLETENPAVRLLKILAKDVDDVFKSDLSWDMKYNIIFSESLFAKIEDTIKNIDIDFNYQLPDLNYKDDVTAFNKALNEFIENKIKE